MNFLDYIEDACMALNEDFYDPQEAFKAAMHAYQMTEDPQYKEDMALDRLSDAAKRLLDLTGRENANSEEEEMELRLRRAQWFIFIDWADLKNKKEIEERKVIVQSAIEGDASRQYALSQMMFDDFSLDSSYWLTRAASQRYLPAIYELGIRAKEKAERVAEVERKEWYEKACAYFQAAAELNFFPAQTMLARINYEIGRPKDAMKWLKVALTNPRKEFEEDVFRNLRELAPLDEITKDVEVYFRHQELAAQGNVDSLSAMAEYYAQRYNEVLAEDMFLEKANKYWAEAERLGGVSEE